MTSMLDEQTAESRLSCFEPCGMEAIPGGRALSCDVPGLGIRPAASAANTSLTAVASLL